MRSVRQRGPGESWGAVCRAVVEQGTCVVHALVDDWLPSEGRDPRALAADLGADHERYARMPASRNRDRFVASRLLLKSAASAVLGALPRELELAYKPGGRPYLRGIDQLDVGLSHTDGLLVVGLTRFGRIGVDTEPADRRMLELGTELKACTPFELEALERVPAERRNRELVRLWTLKEAYSKAIGQGLRFRFTEFGFGPQGERLSVLRPDGTPGTGREWSFHSWLVEDAYTVSAAVHDPGFGDRPQSGADLPLLPVLVDPRSSVS
ncbi:MULTISPECIES: 4'-phosphopantetheinyl transferase family protein [Streptomyces]|uniref:4'-phosphopantetheinyl transferase superfamily protein n=1 Tax=Streptomyces hirsutus TaxID=35620 RepID=A0ABZ1H1T8_9ACTN|nr:4'-phosphopantetheinyl transferase superfamily protein [Streptomyces hirsutus]WSD11346.1 4'-phosphopantetheinyl transferase superfamily protein [Streptomyces hirsutus]WTD22713.1 4'-phosphopantetheinyl transferase superfamily protein [Streptomyces hirsutus]WTD79740.1 4'-phosphopantetheinyl transferase superfamily protein [Streptomyces sp. NBC_01635]